MNLDTVREVGTAENKTFYARGIGLSPLALARLNPDTVREVGTVENKTFYARAGLNPDTIREVGTVENKTFCARDRIESGDDTRSGDGRKQNFLCPRNWARSPRPR